MKFLIPREPVFCKISIDGDDDDDGDDLSFPLLPFCFNRNGIAPTYPDSYACVFNFSALFFLPSIIPNFIFKGIVCSFGAGTPSFVRISFL